MSPSVVVTDTLTNCSVGSTGYWWCMYGSGRTIPRC